MPSAYRIEWSPSAKRNLARLSEKVAAAAVEFIYGGLADNPQRVGRALSLELTGMHAARRGDFRIVYRIRANQRRVVIIAIDHRADIYRRR